MDLSIIIINYNTFDITSNCINSIKKYTSEVDYEIILIDNNSTDIPASRFIERFAGIVLLQNLENVGFAAANNQGIEVANSDYYLLLNSDTILTENSVLAMWNYFKNKSNIGVLGCKLLFENGTVQHSVQRFPSIKYTLIELLRIQKTLPKKYVERILLGSFFGHNEIIIADWIWGTCFFTKKDVINKLPGKKLDSSYFMYGEDMQWCMDIKKLGYLIVFFADTSIIHLGGASKGDKNFLMKKNLASFLKSNYSQWYVLILNFLTLLLTLSLRKSK